MTKYITAIIQPNFRNAMSKAKNDVVKILKEEDYHVMNVPTLSNRFEKLFKTSFLINRLTKDLKPNDLVIIQYPTGLGRRFELKFVERIQSKHAKAVALIHDIDSVRFPVLKSDSRRPNVATEVMDLNNYDFVIASNYAMTKFLKENGLTVRTTNLGIFDYLHPYDVRPGSYSKLMLFAGNLDKSEFLRDFPYSQRVGLDLYGKFSKEMQLPKGAKYRGSYTPEELVIHLRRGFGIVWDGKSAERIDGPLGKYMLINNPHKTSLYLSCGIPVLIWKEAALASFIKNEKCGLCVNSLEDAESKIDGLSVDEYQTMAKNASRIGNRLVKGYYMKNAVATTEKVLLGS